MNEPKHDQGQEEAVPLQSLRRRPYSPPGILVIEAAAAVLNGCVRVEGFPGPCSSGPFNVS